MCLRSLPFPSPPCLPGTHSSPLLKLLLQFRLPSLLRLALSPNPSPVPVLEPPSPVPHCGHTVVFLKWNFFPRLKFSSTYIASRIKPDFQAWEMRNPFMSWLLSPFPASPLQFTLSSTPGTCHPPRYTGFYVCAIPIARNIYWITRKFFVMLIALQFNCLHLALLPVSEFLEISIFPILTPGPISRT